MVHHTRPKPATTSISARRFITNRLKLVSPEHSAKFFNSATGKIPNLASCIGNGVRRHRLGDRRGLHNRGRLHRWRRSHMMLGNVIITVHLQFR